MQDEEESDWSDLESDQEVDMQVDIEREPINQLESPQEELERVFTEDITYENPRQVLQE